MLRWDCCKFSQGQGHMGHMGMRPNKREALAAGSGKVCFYGVLQNVVAWCRPGCES